MLKLGSMLRLCSGASDGDEDGVGEAVGEGDGEGVGDGEGEGEGVGDGVGSTEKTVPDEWVTVAWGEFGSDGSTWPNVVNRP